MKSLSAMTALALLCLWASGCAMSSGNACTPATYSYVVTPSSATVDHSASSPGNQQQFVAALKQVTPSTGSCVVPAVVLAPYQDRWTSSDTVNAPIDSTPGISTNGVATCKGATTVPVTIMATYPLGTYTATASLTCK